MIRILFLVAVLSIGVLYKAGVDIVDSLSPQGCRMSWMSPSYILQSSFDSKWTKLANRYSLYLYREVGWETRELHGSPVLFIPGNAGSSQQVRSIASSAARQYFPQPYQTASQFTSTGHKPLDFFAVEFNEDLSAFHGTTLYTEKEYTSKAVDYILSLYPANTSIIIMGHSMGGVVATSLLPHEHIAAIVSMSTPYIFPPARFDRRIEAIFDSNKHSLTVDQTPILSLCGGATDLMVPSESCYIPNSDVDTQDVTAPYRRTIFTSALEGCWTGVGHREMVWCHQVRWRIARAAIELTRATTSAARGSILDSWLRDGHLLPPGLPTEQHTSVGEDGSVFHHPPGQNLLLRNPHGSGRYQLSVPRQLSTFVLYLSQGSISPTAPHNPLPLHVTVEQCNASQECKYLPPTTLKLLPHPIPGKIFPVPHEGSDESEGIVAYTKEFTGDEGTVSVNVEGADGRGWVVAGFMPMNGVVNSAGALAPFWSTISVKLSPRVLREDIRLPHLVLNALLVYRVTPHVNPECRDTDPLLLPLLQHTSHSSETHYFPLTSSVLIHTHASAPYVSQTNTRGLNFTIHSSGECYIDSLDISIDWWGTIGRWGVRYWSAAGSWAVGVVSLMVWLNWSSHEAGWVPPVRHSLIHFVRRLRDLIPRSLLLSLLPLPHGFWLGNAGQPIFAILAPLLLVVVTALVSLSWCILDGLLWLLGLFVKLTRLRRAGASPGTHNTNNALVSLAMVLITILIVVPWQVAFLGCWIFQLFSCAAGRAFSSSLISDTDNRTYPLTPTTPELLRQNGADDDSGLQSLNDAQEAVSHAESITVHSRWIDESHRNADEHLLLLMTWLLPLAAPVLAVWVRTLMTAGYTTPFDGDHNVLYVAPFLVLVEFGAVRCGFMISRSGSGSDSNLSTRSPHVFVVLAGVAVTVGPRYTYIIFECASVVLGVVLLVNFRRYLRCATR
ncbi:PGAP1-like protein-domain-containing protein [Cristinia sonorae]|uniref:GPI inositol-deacylase n=1 Tax=Cristinia sonorae TaxID=1940300 RepID=A0A8K0XN21_9AGAR|nr:PGAP1-like protein-domain-containing protein [Cristinia sonorae]